MSKRKTRSSTKGTNNNKEDGNDEPHPKKPKITDGDGKETKQIPGPPGGAGKCIIPDDQQEGLLDHVIKHGQPNEEMTRAFRWLIALDVKDHHDRRHRCVQLGEFIKDKYASMRAPIHTSQENEKKLECGKVIYNVDEYLRQFLYMKAQVCYHELIQLVRDKVTPEYSFANGDCVDPHNTVVIFPETAWVWTNDSGKIVSYSVEISTLDRLSMRVFEQGKLPIVLADELKARLADKGLAKQT